MSPPRLAVLALLAAGCAPSAPAAPALTEAIDDPGDPGVVALIAAEGEPVLRCTAVVIAERVVLTAAHCGAQRDPAAFEVFFGPSLDAGATRVPLIAAVAHPEYDGGADHDLALLLLAEPSPAPPLRLVEDDTLASPPPVDVRLVGYGLTAPGAADDDRKREGRARTNEVLDDQVLLAADPSLPCNGDSGGPVLVDTPAGERVGAIVAGGDEACAERARAARIDTHRAFLDARLAAWAPASVPVAEGCLYDAHCVSGRCVVAEDEPELRYCSEACATDAECPDVLACRSGECRYPPPSPGAVGAACASHDDCVRGDCLDEMGVCSIRCVSGRGDCGAGFSCEHLGGIDFYCLAEPAPDGCAAAPASPSSPLALLLLALSLALARRA